MFKEMLHYSGQKLIKKRDDKRIHTGLNQSTPLLMNTTIPGIPTHMNYPPPRRESYPALPSAYDPPRGPPPPYFDAQAIASARRGSTAPSTRTRSFLSSVQSRVAASLMPPKVQALPKHQPQLNSRASVTKHQQPQFTLRASITKEFVTDLSANRPLVIISQAKKDSNPLLKLTRWGGRLLGTVRFSGRNRGVVFTLHGHESKIKNEGQLADQWCYRTTVFDGERWCWQMKDSKHGELLVGSGEVMAKLAEGLLTIERGDLSHAAIDEIMVTAFAVWEKNRRDQNEGESAADIMLGGG